MYYIIVFGNPVLLTIEIIASCETESNALDTSSKHIFKVRSFCLC